MEIAVEYVLGFLHNYIQYNSKMCEWKGNNFFILASEIRCFCEVCTARIENYQEQIVLVHLVQKCLIKKINFHVFDECPNYKQMFGQLTSARNRGGYVVFTDYKACMCSYGISLNDRIKSWLFIVNNGMGIQITSISPKKCWYY